VKNFPALSPEGAAKVIDGGHLLSEAEGTCVEVALAVFFLILEELPLVSWHCGCGRSDELIFRFFEKGFQALLVDVAKLVRLLPSLVGAAAARATHGASASAC
jgi:hypothetical protein